MRRDGLSYSMRWLAWVLLLFGCFTPVVPPETRVTCTRNDECPGSSCVVRIGLCAEVGADATAPEVVDVTISAGPVGFNGEVFVSFATVGRLLVPPDVVIGGVHPTITVAGDRVSALLRAQDVATLGVTTTVPISVVLVGAGGSINDIPLGDVVIDLFAPTVVGHQITITPPAGSVPVAEVATIGSTVEICVQGSEPNRASVRVIGDVIANFVQSAQPNPVSSCHRLEVRQALGNGDVLVLVTLLDEAGNGGEIDLAEFPAARNALSPCVATDSDGPRCTDADADGFFGINTGCALDDIEALTPPFNRPDCDDTKTIVYPNAFEIGGNDIDEDCDGVARRADEVDAIFVDPSAVAPGDGSVAAPFVTLQQATAVQAGRTIHLRAGNYIHSPTELTPCVIDREQGFPLTGSLVGGFVIDDGEWRLGSERSELSNSARTGSTLFVVGLGAMTIHNININTPSLAGILIQDPVGDVVSLSSSNIRVEVVSDASLDGDGVCIASAVFTQRPLRISNAILDGRCQGNCGQTAAVSTSNILSGSLLVADSNLMAQGSSGSCVSALVDATGAGGQLGLFARINASTSCPSPLAINCRRNTNCIVVGSTLTSTSTASSDGVGVSIDTGIVAHNTIVASGSQAFGVLMGSGLVVANAVATTGNAATALVITDAADVRGNALSMVASTTCAIAAGDACQATTAITGCAPPTCTIDDGNVEWLPPQPVPTTVLIADAATVPTATVIDFDGDCRGASPEAGANELD
jgi:hypothetical protein